MKGGLLWEAAVAKDVVPRMEGVRKNPPPDMLGLPVDQTTWQQASQPALSRDAHSRDHNQRLEGRDLEVA